MGIKNPRQLIQILKDLTDEIERFTVTVDETIKQANYTQRLTKEYVNQGLHYAGIMQNSVVEYSYQITEIQDNIRELSVKCYQGEKNARDTLTQANNADNLAQDTLNHWQNELDLAREWLDSAEIALQQANQEYEDAKSEIQLAKDYLQSAKNDLKSCLDYRDSEGRKKDCSAEYDEVDEAKADLKSAKKRLERAEIEIQNAQEEVNEAQARVNCCQNAINYAERAVECSITTVDNAKYSLICAEKSLEEINRIELFLSKAKENLVKAQESAENMMRELKNAEKTTDDAQNYFQKAENLSEITYKYAKLGCREIDDKIDSLIKLNRPESSFSVSRINNVSSPSSSLSNTVPFINIEQEKQSLNNVFQELAEFRVKLGLPPAGSENDRSTIAKLEVKGNGFFGINSGSNPNKKKITLKINIISKTHAEADAFQEAFNRGVRGSKARLIVDRDLCRACGEKGGVKGMAKQLGLDELEIITPSGIEIIKLK